MDRYVERIGECMSTEVWMMMKIIVVLCLVFISIGIAIQGIKRERKLSEHIQKMLDDAIAGKFQEKHLRETRISAIENSMWRYLCDREVQDKRMREEKQQIQKQITDISHQAVIPIANIILYSQLLEERLSLLQVEEGQEVANEITVIKEQAEALDFLIEALGKLSRLESGIINMDLKKHSLQPILTAIKNQFQIKAEQKDILLKIEMTNEMAVFDAKWTIEALSNIVDNAIKYTACGGQVTVRVEPLSSLIRVVIKDTGIGIAEEEQANVFGRFYRSKTVSYKSGVGIGLYLAREVMKAQNGYIKLFSKVGEGSIFSLYFMKQEISQN